MLCKKNISKVRIHSEEWYQGRLAKFTASEIYNIMGDKFETEGATNYIYRKVGEELSGMPCRDEIDTPATRHGLLYEPEAIKLFGERMGLKFVVTQALITAPGSRFGCTPDLVIPILESKDKKFYNVETGEVKCPLSYDGYIKLFVCDTPEQVRAVSKPYFWQVIMQMQQCDCLKGHFIIYNPFFRAGQMKVITFRKVELRKEFQLLEQRQQMAEAKFIEIRDKLLAA